MAAVDRRQSGRDLRPIGPTEQLPLVARIVNDLELDVRSGHFWGMDEWYADDKEVPETHPLSFARADRELCFDRIDKRLRLPEANLHFPKADVRPYVESWDSARCAVMQGGQGRSQTLGLQRSPAPPRRLDRHTATARGVSQARHPRR